MNTFQKIWLLLAFMSIATAFSQNLKPTPKPDTIRLNLNDSICVNILTNDVDPNNDAIRLSKFYKWSIPNLIQDYSFKTDTASFTINRSGKVCVKAKKAGIFKYSYIPQDGKAGAGKTGYVILIVKNPATEWMECKNIIQLVHKDSIGKITLFIADCEYSGYVGKGVDYYCNGFGYYKWVNGSKEFIRQKFVVLISKDVYEWAVKL